MIEENSSLENTDEKKEEIGISEGQIIDIPGLNYIE